MLPGWARDTSVKVQESEMALASTTERA